MRFVESNKLESKGGEPEESCEDSHAFMKEVKVEIFNRTYILRGDKPTAELRRVAREVDYHMKEVAEEMPKMDMTRTAVLAALNLAEEHLELQERYERVVQMLEKEYRRNRTDMSEDDPVIPFCNENMEEDAEGEEG